MSCGVGWTILGLAGTGLILRKRHLTRLYPIGRVPLFTSTSGLAASWRRQSRQPKSTAQISGATSASGALQTTCCCLFPSAHRHWDGFVLGSLVYFAFLVLAVWTTLLHVTITIWRFPQKNIS